MQTILQGGYRVQRTYYFFFFFNDTATTEIYTLSLHDALPIYALKKVYDSKDYKDFMASREILVVDRKSTRLNSSHLVISYAVFCLKKKKKLLRTTVSSVSNTPQPDR